MEVAKLTKDKDIMLIKEQVSKAVEAANAIQIKADKDMPAAVDLLAKIKKVGKIITQKKEAITKPLNEALRNARAFFSPFETEYAKAEKIVKDKMEVFDAARIKKADKKEAEIVKKVESGEMSYDKASEKLEAIEPENTIKSSEGSVQFRVNKVVNVIDESLLPREYLIPDFGKIRKAALSGINIPGVEVVEKRIVAGIAK